MGLEATRPFGIDVRRGPGRVRVALAGELDLLTASVVDARVAAVADDRDRVHVVLDFSDVRFIDCAGVAMLVRMRKRALAHGSRLSVVRCDEHIRRVFELTRTTELLSLGESASAS